MGDYLHGVAYLEDDDVDSKGALVNPQIPKNVPVVILIYGSWCPACKVFKPTFQQFADQYKDKVFVAAIQQDGQRPSEQALCKRVKSFYPEFRGFPTVLLYKGGKRVNKELQSRTVEGLEEFALS